MTTRAVRHAGIVVTDMERSLGFYRDMLGLEVAVDQLETGRFIEEILAMPGARVRTVKLSAPEGPTLVELLEFEGSDGGTGSPDLARIGPTHVALTVDDLEALHASLAGQGVPFLSEPRVSRDGRARVAFCADPDGTMLELVEPLED
jgi:catechol 2,3-dioxygenase-like lactoylglutathione lyase family enzyme